MSGGRKRTGLLDMAMVAREEAERIRASQTALIRLGELRKPHPSQMSKAEAFDDIADLILKIIPVKSRVADIIRTVSIGMDRDRDHDPPADLINPDDDEQHQE